MAAFVAAGAPALVPRAPHRPCRCGGRRVRVAPVRQWAEHAAPLRCLAGRADGQECREAGAPRQQQQQQQQQHRRSRSVAAADADDANASLARGAASASSRERRPPLAEWWSNAWPFLALNAATVLWGSQHAVIKQFVDTAGDPALVNLGRFWLAALVLAPFALLRQRDRSVTAQRRAADDASLSRRLAAAGELGLWMFAGYAFQSIGLQFTTASRSGFLLYLNVKLVPILAAVFYRRRIPAASWLSAAIALAGTALLSYDGTPPNAGDAWSVAAALASAVFILRLERASQLVAPAELNAASLLAVALLCSAWSAWSAPASASASLSPPVLLQLLATWFRGGGGSAEAHGADAYLFPIVYLGLATTALSNWLQTLGQRRVSAEKAAVIFALDPVYGAGFAYLLLDETLGVQGWSGALLIIVAAVMSQRAAGSLNSCDLSE